MYSYKFDKEENKILMETAEEKVLEADVSIDGNVAKVVFVYIKENEAGTSLFSLVSSFCSNSKSLLLENGISVDKVVCGGLLSVAKYDDIYNSMNEELANNVNVRANKR